MRDNSDILLVGEPEVYEFLDAMIRSVRTLFTGKRIHIGMDEAFQLGLGKLSEPKRISGSYRNYEAASGQSL